MRYLQTGAALTAISCLPSTFATPLQPVFKRQSNTTQPERPFDWDDIEAKPTFDWQPCFENFTCTKLEVPLDYEDEDVGTTGIAFIKWTTNSTSDTQDILLNPGGPGGSGVDLLLGALPDLKKRFGTGYNLVSFDPRSVGYSGPDVSCFPGERGTGRFYDPDLLRIVDVNDERSLREAFAKSGAFGEFCSKAHAAGNDTAKYANTVATATDMLRYTEVLAKSKGENPTKSELWYYGISYGTVLGTTFAALFPDRVGRVIVDGVVDGDDYYAGKWRSNLIDADQAVKYFFEQCHEAGPEKCALWDESPEAIEGRFNDIMDDVAKSPISVSDMQTPAIITTSHLKQLVMRIPYDPIKLFPVFAKIFAELETRNATTLLSIQPVGVRVDDCSEYSFVPETNIEAAWYIGCNDANNRFRMNEYGEWVDQANFLYNQSHFLGESWATSLALNCRSLEAKSPDSQVFEGAPKADKTKNPLLFVSSRVDPVTPLVAAEKMVKRFGDAGLLVQNSVGHASFSAPSECTSDIFKKYMKDGSVPDRKECDADEFPFHKDQNENEAAKMLRKRLF